MKLDQAIQLHLEKLLGAHKERIRQMLLSAYPRHNWECSILAFAVLNGVCNKLSTA